MGEDEPDQIDEIAAAALKAAIANLDMNASDYYFACSQHVGGLCVSGFSSYDDARNASDSHKKDTGHTDCYPSSGRCPF